MASSAFKYVPQTAAMTFAFSSVCFFYVSGLASSSFDKKMFLCVRALETENELLQDELRRVGARNNHELDQQVLRLEQTNREQHNQLVLLAEQRQQLQEQLDGSEQDKLRLARQLTAAEKHLETSRSQINKVTKGGVTDLLFFLYFPSIFLFRFSLSLKFKP